MSSFSFTKMHGCGNDYVFVDAWQERLPRDLPALARAISDRHQGVGADGLILVGPSRRADCRMVMFNADGSRSEMCGNGLRCAAKLAHDHQHVRSPIMRVETGAGILTVHLHRQHGEITGARVAMGHPRLQPALVPVTLSRQGPLLPLTLRLGGTTVRLLAVGMGNPHAVCFVRDPDRFAVTAIGPLIERHPRFPRRTNVEFVKVLAERSASGLPIVRQRTWERGSGETQACGTGACATLVAAILQRRITTRAAVIRLTGGDLEAAWPDDGAEVILSGPAVTVFTGRWG
jgi:diaminopimelate epimerase